MVNRRCTPRQSVARLRCIKQCLTSFSTGGALPRELCYVPLAAEYYPLKNGAIVFYSSPTISDTNIVASVTCNSAQHRLTVGGEEVDTSDGKWARVLKHSCTCGGQKSRSYPDNTWVVLVSYKTNEVRWKACDDNKKTAKNTASISSWLKLVDETYSQVAPLDVSPGNEDVMDKLSSLPPNWTQQHDAQLAQLLFTHGDVVPRAGLDPRHYISAIEASSTASSSTSADNLLDLDRDHMWQSDCDFEGKLFLRLHMKSGCLIQKLLMTILDDSDTDEYVPEEVTIKAGEKEPLETLYSVKIDTLNTGIRDVCILDIAEENLKCYPIVDIVIDSCRGSKTAIVLGLKVEASWLGEGCVKRDCFTEKNLQNYSKLRSYSVDHLYYRSVALLRFVTLFDSVLHFLLPLWDSPTKALPTLAEIEPLTCLSKQRHSLTQTLLDATADYSHTRSSDLVKVYLDRLANVRHGDKLPTEQAINRTVFIQIYESLKRAESESKLPLTYRWPSSMTRWWECRMRSEDIIDAGGGFRDTVSNIADELCPADVDTPLILPFFVRSPNQLNPDDNLCHDAYVPNSSCVDFPRFKWIGQLMGACFRGQENLAISLPMFFWKKLIGQSVTWSVDYATVDEMEVKLIDDLVVMDRDKFDTFCLAERTFTTVLCSGHVVPLTAGGEVTNLSYDTRLQYADLVRDKRLNEFNQQIEAISEGFLSVVPSAALRLNTWHEIEMRVCGEPKITFEDLKAAITFELSASDSEEKKAEQMLLTALGHFTDAERSQFLRFVTGRKRLPARIAIGEAYTETNSLPTSATCGNMLQLPKYDSAELCEERLRYAITHCLTIDGDGHHG